MCHTCIILTMSTLGKMFSKDNFPSKTDVILEQTSLQKEATSAPNIHRD